MQTYCAHDTLDRIFDFDQDGHPSMYCVRCGVSYPQGPPFGGGMLASGASINTEPAQTMAQYTEHQSNPGGVAHSASVEQSALQNHFVQEGHNVPPTIVNIVPYQQNMLHGLVGTNPPLQGLSSTSTPTVTRVPCRISIGPPCDGFIGDTKAEVRRHLRRSHGVDVSSNSVMCPFEGCTAQMRGDSLGRHAVSKHLGRGRVYCGGCGKSFARSDSFKPHVVNGIQCDGRPVPAA